MSESYYYHQTHAFELKCHQPLLYISLISTHYTSILQLCAYCTLNMLMKHCATMLQGALCYKVLAMVPSSAGLRFPVLLATANTTK